MPANISYGCKLNGCFGYDRIGATSKKMANKRAGFTENFAIRLRKAQIERGDALRIIQSRDMRRPFFILIRRMWGVIRGIMTGIPK
jgi:DNA adenine methylase